MHETNIREDFTEQYTAPVIVSNDGETVTVSMSLVDYSLCREFLNQQYITQELKKSEALSADPTVKRYTHDEVMTPYREKYGYEYDV